MSDSQSHLSAAAQRRISLDGWWIARSAQLGGVRLPDDALPGLSMVLFNQTLYLGSDVGTIDVDHAVVPATFDVLIVRGPNKWRFLPGIAAVSGRTMRMCLDLSGAARPGAFVSPFGSRLFFVTYERTPVRDLHWCGRSTTSLPTRCGPPARKDSIC